MKKKTMMLLSVVVIIFAAIILFIIKDDNNEAKVKYDRAKIGEVYRYINTTGVIESKEKKEYYLQEGIINEVNVSVGDYVEKGQLLLTLPFSTIKSDINGVVSEINVVDGGYSSPTMPVIIVQNIEDLRISILLNQNDSKLVKVDQEVIVRGSNGDIKGRVSIISPVAKMYQGSMDNEAYLKAEVDNLNSIDGLIVGFKNEIDILVGEKTDVLLVPTEAIKSEKGNRNYVFVIKDNVVQKREVQIGLEGELEVEIISGINVDEEVVLNPIGTLVDGAKIRKED
ncbi:efflux RND transporter periplasmic adaptor subunit [Clostridium sp.]|uniref:efflux RND transporter periplasmic adaptor subunit n=1 Tax=Clostridium sp. TaxID=1506 RepID=UPI003F2EC759